MYLFLLVGIVVAIFIGVYGYFYLKRMLEFFHLQKKGVIKTVAPIGGVFLGASCLNVWSTPAVIVLHIMGIQLLMQLFTFLVQKTANGELGKARTTVEKVYQSGLFPLVATLLILLFAHVNLTHPVQTDYTIASDKLKHNYNVLLITDTHFGTIQKKEILENKIADINKNDLDFAILGGDIVEEGTTKAEMEQVFSILGNINTKYGIYYVYGNHDRQSYTSEKSYTVAELEQVMKDNGITILQDSYVGIGEELLLAGRDDAAWGNTSGRVDIDTLLQGADANRFVIVADHQPIEAEENGAWGVDLEVSGHTHAGQVWPVGAISELTGVLNYGEYERNGCKVIVSSGFAGWGYPFRTEQRSEYVVLHLQPQ